MADFLMSVDGVISVPCVVFALRRESMYFRRAYPLRQHFTDAPCRAQLRGLRGTSASDRGSPVLMLETGIGAAAMETAVRWCLSQPYLGGVPYRPCLLICAGYSGALQSQQQVGDLVLASEVTDQHSNRWPASVPDGFASGDIASGRLLTMANLVTDPQQKQRLGQQYRALAVDMESAVAARLCHEHCIPFSCLRVISDDWQTALSAHLVALLRQGNVSIPRLAGQVIRRPRLIGELWRLAGQTRQASRRLVRPLSALIRDGLRRGVFR